jgi:hypothetical protein
MIESIDDFHFEEDGHKYIEQGRSRPSVTGLLKKYGLIDYSMVKPDVLEHKRKQGIVLHAWTERYDREGNDDMLVLPEPSIGYAEAWVNFRRQNEFELIDIERRMMAELMGVVIGGTPDRLMRIKRTQDLVLDLKFCSSPMPAWGPQTAAYTMMKFKKLNIGNTQRCSCQLFPNGRFRVHWYDKESDGDAFLSIIALEAWKQNQGMKG